jgi:hypothetical protein
MPEQRANETKTGKQNKLLKAPPDH